MSQPACQLPSSSPSLWGQFPDIPLSSFHTPGNSQEQQQQQQRNDGNEQLAAAGEAGGAGGGEEVADADFDDLGDAFLSASPSPTPTPTLNPFDVGLPWTQGHHFPTQLQRRFFLDKFKLPNISTRADDAEDDDEPVVVVAETSAAGARREDRRKRARVVAGETTTTDPQASSSRPRPRARASVQSKEQPQGADAEVRDEDGEPSATQFFSRRRPGTARDSPQDDDEEARARRLHSPSHRSASPRRDNRSATDADASRAPTAEAQDTSDAQDDAGAMSASISISTSTLPSSNRSLSVPTPPPPTGIEPQARRGLAPLLPELSAEKQAGYWAQLSSVAGHDSLLFGGSAWDMDDSRQQNPTTPAALRGRGSWAERVHSDSRLLPNRFMAAQEENEATDEEEEQLLDPDYVDGQGQGMYAAAARRARMAAGDGSNGAAADETIVRPCAGAAQTMTTANNAPAPMPGIRSALDITADMLEAAPAAAAAAGPSYRLSDLTTPARSRNQHGMGLARKTWDTTWLADGGRVVRGRVVKSNTGDGPFGGRGASSTGGVRGRKKTTGRGAAEQRDGSPSAGAAAARRGGWRGRGRGAAPQRGRGRGR